MNNPTTSFVSLSRNGRYAVFSSAANNLVPNDTNAAVDVFVRDLQTDAVTCISAPNGSDVPVGGTAGVISDDGRYAVFLSTTLTVTANPGSAGLSSLFLRDLVSHTTTAIAKTTTGSLAYVDSQFSMSADGRLTAFQTSGKLMAGQTDFNTSIYLYDRSSATVKRMTTTSNDSYYQPTLSANGAYLSFLSGNSKFVANDTNNALDVFLMKVDSLAITRVSVADDGSQANANSGSMSICLPSVSDDGRYVVFASNATNLLPGVTATPSALYLRDTLDGHTYCLTTSAEGVPGVGSWPTISADGRYVAFTSYRPDIQPTTQSTALHVLDRSTGEIRRISATPGGEPRSAQYPWISADGSRVAFISNATDLTPGDTNRTSDAFVAEVAGGQITRVSAGPSQVERGGGTAWVPAVSSDGRYVLFQASSSSLTTANQVTSGLFRHDRLTGETRYVTPNAFVGASTDGRFVAVYGTKPMTVPPYDFNTYLWVVDIDTGTQTLASVGIDGTPVAVDTTGPMGLSGDGNRVLYTPSVSAQSLLQHDLQAGTTAQVNLALDGTRIGFAADRIIATNSDGRYVAFSSARQSALGGSVTNITAVSIKDMLSGTMTEAAIISESPSSGRPLLHQYSLTDRLNMSADGRFVVFSSNENNLVPNDTSGQLNNYFSGTDVFVYDRVTTGLTRVSVASDGTQANDICCQPSISDDGRFVAFVSSATNLVNNHPNPTPDVYLHDRITGQTTLISVRPDSLPGDLWSGADATTTTGPNDNTGGGAISDGHNSSTAVLSTNGFISGRAGQAICGMALSGNGQWVAFASKASDLVPNDTNGAVDIFVRGPLRPSTGVTVPTVAKALRVCAGLEAADGLDALNLETSGLSTHCIDMSDVIAWCKQVDPTVWGH